MVFLRCPNCADNTKTTYMVVNIKFKKRTDIAFQVVSVLFLNPKKFR